MGVRSKATEPRWRWRDRQVEKGARKSAHFLPRTSRAAAPATGRPGAGRNSGAGVVKARRLLKTQGGRHIVGIGAVNQLLAGRPVSDEVPCRRVFVGQAHDVDAGHQTKTSRNDAGGGKHPQWASFHRPPLNRRSGTLTVRGGRSLSRVNGFEGNRTSLIAFNVYTILGLDRHFKMGSGHLCGTVSARNPANTADRSWPAPAKTAFSLTLRTNSSILKSLRGVAPGVCVSGLPFESSILDGVSQLTWTRLVDPLERGVTGAGNRLLGACTLRETSRAKAL